MSRAERVPSGLRGHAPACLRAAVATVAIVLAIGHSACGGIPEEPPPEVIDGDPQAGAQAIQEHGCGACHRIAGISQADSMVGPPLDDFSQRRIIAGRLPNTAENVIRFLRDPDSVSPGTAMPDLGLTEQEALDIAAYLHTLD